MYMMDKIVYLTMLMCIDENLCSIDSKFWARVGWKWGFVVFCHLSKTEKMVSHHQLTLLKSNAFIPSEQKPAYWPNCILE